MKNSVVLFLILPLISCQTPSSRAPANQSPQDLQELSNLVSLVYEKSSMQAVRPLAITPVQEPKVLTPLSANIGFPLNVRGNYASKWRSQEESFSLTRLSDFALVNGQIQRIFTMDRFGTKEYRLELMNALFSKEVPGPEEEPRRDPESLRAQIMCDGDYKLKTNAFPARARKAGEVVSFNFYDSFASSQRVLLYPGDHTRSCELRLTQQGRQYGLRIVDDVEDPNLSLNALIDGCYLPKASNLQGIERFFLSDKFKSMTCVNAVEAIQTLEDPVDALRSKVEALLGLPISPDFVQNYDPNAPLDFSHAPQLDNIYVSYLVFRADFYGRLISRLLEYHADRGTRVKILISDVIALKKDRAMFERMTREHNNIKIQEFRYVRQKGESLKAKFDEFHRTMHVKLLITTSKARPEWNVTYIGGRNIHDGFVFKNPPGEAKDAAMVSYLGGDESFCHWRDFEVKIADPAFAQKAAAHFLTLWNFDTKTLAVRSINQNLLQSQGADKNLFKGEKPLVRHYMSFPYKDNHSLEVLYSDMIDAAEKSVKISTPYFRPTAMFTAALQRAVKRGVDITLITRLDLEGDTIDWLLSDANKAGVNQFWDKLKIFEYTEPKVILHSKIVLVDGKFSFIGSVNLNKRSFYHDLENGAMVYSPDFYRRMERIYASYLKDARRITGPLQTSPLKKVILDMFDTAF